jgi:polysaccharide export outer membrane protein
MATSFVRIVVLAVSLLLLTPLASLGQTAASAPPLRLRPGDAVRLLVRDEPELAGEFPVDESGQVMLPLIGLIRVAGRDFVEVRREVAAGYDRELTLGEVSITPLLRIAVLGEVRLPGLYPVDPTHTLADVIALAGGLAPTAKRDRILLVRDGEEIAISADESLTLTRELRSGDQIVVGRRSWLQENTAILVSGATSLAVAVITTLLLRQ